MLSQRDGNQHERLEGFDALWSSPVIMFVVDREGRVTGANGCARRLIGESHATPWRMRKLSDLLAPVPIATRAPADGSRNAEPTQRVAILHQSGLPVYVDWCAVPMASPPGGSGGRLLLGHPAPETEEVEAGPEAHEREAQRMEAIGRLAGGIAHDFNNRLTVILGHANLIRFGIQSGADATPHINAIEAAALRAAQLTQQLLGFARKGKLQNIPVDLHRMIGDVVSLLAHSIDKRITIRQQLTADHAWVQGDPAQLQQVLLNLASNAVDAMPRGGELWFETRCVDADGADDPHGRLQLRVRDTGMGMTDDVRARIFEPFFTTKSPQTNVGMGLSMVYGIVRNHGGHVEVDSTVQGGTTFHVSLPLRAMDVNAHALVLPERMRSSTRGRILVVDDEDEVRNVVVGMLQRLGYDAAVAVNGREALDYYRQHGAGVTAVLLDMVMPVMNGRDCCMELVAMDPSVRIVVATGHSSESQALDANLGCVRGKLQKPFSLERLGSELRRVVNG